MIFLVGYIRSVPRFVLNWLVVLLARSIQEAGMCFTPPYLQCISIHSMILLPGPGNLSIELLSSAD